MQVTFNKMLSSWGTANNILTFEEFFFGRGRYLENLENGNNEQIILENAI